jgi:hypothetical protein
MVGRRPASLAALVAVLSGCTGHAPVPGGPPSESAAAGLGSVSASASTPMRTSTGWTVTVYYTAVERYHHGAATRVTGCPRMDCQRRGADLGSYPDDFVEAVRDEGTGRLADGRYLNWSSDTGYWLDTAPRDSAGGALRPWVSAAADRAVLPSGTRFAIVDCGHGEGGGKVDATVCARLREARWTVTDEFTPGLGGPHHVDLYIGEETGPGFTDSVWYTTLVGAVLQRQG